MHTAARLYDIDINVIIKLAGISSTFNTILTLLVLYILFTVHGIAMKTIGSYQKLLIPGFNL